MSVLNKDKIEGARLVEIDATGKSPGRLATQVATILMGKDSPSFRKHLAPNVIVEVKNILAIKISPKKMKEKKYASYSGYPGGLKFRTMSAVVEKHGAGDVLRRAVFGMLPKNKLRPLMMKRLNILE